MSLILKDLHVDGYERVIEAKDDSVGLHAIIAIHNTSMGPALGGIRIYPYTTFDQALTDVLRLSRGMTYKAAIANVGLGGGKSVIIADPKTDKTEGLLLAFARLVNSLEGTYICAEDSGCTTDDVKVIRQESKYVVGLAHDKSSGDPSPFTAWATFRGIQASLMHLYGDESVKGKTIAIQGLGSVGRHLAQFLFWHGAHLIVADINKEEVHQAEVRLGAKAVAPEEILQVECDVLAPCAMGGILNQNTIPNLKCKAVAGCANNQLLEDSDGKALLTRGILYAPDFVINAGGLINVSLELNPEGYDPALARNKMEDVYHNLMQVYELSEQNKCSTHAAAISLADYRIQYLIGKRSVEPCFHEMATVC